MPKLKRLTGQMNTYWVPVSEDDRIALEGCAVIEAKTEKQRTLTQNKSMWLYCELLAEALSEAGYDQQRFPWREGIEIPFTKYSVMECFWRPVMDAMADKASTTEQTTKDVMAVYEAVSRAMAMRVGVSVAWPCRESQNLESQMRGQA
jgi:hypothetical protein